MTGASAAKNMTSNSIRSLHLITHQAKQSFIYLISSTSPVLNSHPLSFVVALFLIAITGSISNLSNKLKFLLLSCALSAYTLSILYFLNDSLTRGQNFLASCTFPLVIRKDTTFLDFASAAICNFINSFFFRIHLSSVKSPFLDTVRPDASTTNVIGSLVSLSFPIDGLILIILLLI